MILKEPLKDYIFLSRKVPLPLSALKIIKERISFEEVMEFSELKFKKLLALLKNESTVSLRDIDGKVRTFANRSRHNYYKEIETELEICEKNDIKCIGYFDKEYPSILKIMKNPPKLIFIKGEIKKEDQKAVAIIGTRNPTSYGKKMAEEIAKGLSEKGFTIISGFARGIDTIAMISALNNGGRTIGVIASGILNLYPKENQIYLDKLVNNGALISERFPLKNVTTRALQTRNKITSGLGLGNIFVEGNEYSGTKWQFKYGKEQQKPAFAVEPLDPKCEQAFIPNWIIKDKGGARISGLGDLDFVEEVLMDEYKIRKARLSSFTKRKNQQTSLFEF